MFAKRTDGVLISYNGPFFMNLISGFGKYMTENLIAPEAIKMKLYRVFIELTQNVSRYSAERDQLSDASSIGVGTLFIHNNNEYFKCTTINEILTEHEKKLTQNCADINNSSVEELKLRKTKLRKESSVLDTGAHIGLIAVCLYSGNPLDFEILNGNKNRSKYFSITATINKINGIM